MLLRASPVGNSNSLAHRARAAARAFAPCPPSHGASCLQPGCATHRRNLLVRSSTDDARTETVEFAPELLSSPDVTSDQQTATAPAPARLQPISYPLVAGLAAFGLLETTYLTAVKLFNTPLVCPASGCENVLTSGYSELFGLPLSFFGMLAYGGVALIAKTAMGERAKLESETTSIAEASDLVERLNLFNNGLVVGSGLLAGTSATLMFLLATQLGAETCVWCYTSALLSASLLGAVVSGLGGKQRSSAVLPGAGAFFAAIFILNLGFGGLMSNSAASTANLVIDYYKPEVETESSNEAIALAKRLADAGAHMYGAFWCTHCYDQKSVFGAEAMKDFPYVECYPEGWQKGQKMNPACTEAGVKAFPTWEINGKLIEGELSLSEAEAALSK